ncbi:CPBP family intramembrane glutamic endopeptidase [Falsarthrobacter nasiphocae]|uniref:Membrane protease YdiL (CAAX protease family) n=1 Tax=Falsarthrobacter nasiphocae TaxID=189863 RepID=A0AAE4C646_9MICC|nr:CPBP family intramembrane glutamic endopeptidase [Falsarthrobacter nasiphocae]MDR6892178.1 membrane protease YdiL (CAAX protease family) [Falsarthrobacter nasiphocae]
MAPEQTSASPQHEPNGVTRWAALLVPSGAAAAGLAIASAAPRGGAIFYAATFGVAAVYAVAWVLWGRGVRGGAPMPASPALPARAELRRGVLIGLGLLALFLIGAQVVRVVPSLLGPVQSLLDNARVGPLWLTAMTTALNGLGEEAYFRRVIPRSLRGSLLFRAIISMGLYLAVTAALGVPLLAVAALLVGGAAFWEAERSGSLVSPTALHLTWSLGMLVALPLVL